MYYYLDVTHMGGTQRIIFRRTGENSVTQFPLVEGNPYKPEYDAWVAEGNTAEEWSPDGD